MIAPFSTSNVISSEASPTLMRSLVTRHRLLRLNEKRIDIRWRDLDAFGHVNQAVYGTYGEEIVDAWFRDVLELEEGEVWDYVVVRLTTDFRSELRLADRQVVGSTRIVRIGNSSVTVALELRAASDGRLAAETECVFAAWSTETRRSRPLTEREHELLEAAA
jgi:acyl-CoA thioester hydrolase